MFRMEFGESDVQALDHERYHHPHPRVQRKMEIAYSKSQGLPPRRDRAARATPLSPPGKRVDEASQELGSAFPETPARLDPSGPGRDQGDDGHRTLTHTSRGVSRTHRTRAAQGRDDPGQGRYGRTRPVPTGRAGAAPGKSRSGKARCLLHGCRALRAVALSGLSVAGGAHFYPGAERTPTFQCAGSARRDSPRHPAGVEGSRAGHGAPPPWANRYRSSAMRTTTPPITSSSLKSRLGVSL